jgi:ABC-type uncharacterized transport system ATPase component
MMANRPLYVLGSNDEGAGNPEVIGVISGIAMLDMGEIFFESKLIAGEGRYRDDKQFAALNISETDSTRMTPERDRAAEKVASEPTRAPVWLILAAAPAS